MIDLDNTCDRLLDDYNPRQIVEALYRAATHAKEDAEDCAVLARAVLDLTRLEEARA